MKKYSRIFFYLGHYKKKVALYIVVTILVIVFSLFSFALLYPFLDVIFNGQNSAVIDADISKTDLLGQMKNHLMRLISASRMSSTALLAVTCLVMIVAVFFKNLFTYLSLYILNPLKNQITNRLRSDLYEKILTLPIGYFNEKRKGDLISRITNDVSEVEGSVVGALEGWFRDPITIIITLVALFWVSPILTTGILITIPVIGFILGRISKALKKDSNDAAIKQGETLSVLDETLNGLRVIKAFNIESVLRERFSFFNDGLLRAKNKIIRRRDAASPVSEFLGVLVFIGIVFFGGRQILSNQLDMEPAAFLAYLTMFYTLINPVKTLSTSFSNLNKGSAAINRIEEVLHTPVTVDDNPDGKKLESFNSTIEFRNVRFAYDDAVILDDINLIIEKGNTVALVGSSGAGKSTLADLVPRFHDVTGGEVLIDGVNIKDYSLHSVRNLMSVVTQEPILFNDSIANNIALGNSEATNEEVIGAAKIANAHNFIIQKEDKYDTNIGDRGNKLSGGEKQRLTIARAVLKNPPILILDEATSSLDTESERLVQDAINNMMQNRTVIVIAHRLSTIRHADEIIVLQKGKIVERGTHEELISQNGFYKKLVEMQEVA